jgi:2-methylcitrate dehydratase
MDECSRRLVEYASSYHVNYTDGFLEAFNYLMLASLADVYSGFESQPARINSRLSQTMRGDMKCTVVGYGVVTTPEMAAFTNACMSRHADFNDHTNELLWGVLAIGEALHSSGPDVIDAMTIAYEVVRSLDGAAGGAVGVTGNGGYDVMYHAPATALACGRLMGLDKDQLANALSIALVPHIPLAVTHTGILSMWKGNHSAEQVRNGVWGALLASGGMTGPAEPFEGRDGVIEHVGAFGRDLRLPYSANGQTAIEAQHANGRGYKALPAVGSSVVYINNLLPDVVAWVRPEEVANIDIHMSVSLWQEDGDPPKFDPQCRETSDHSLAYITCRGIIDKQVYIDTFTHDKYMDPVVREMMQKVRTIPSVHPGPVVWTIRKKSGEERSFSYTGTSLLSHDDNVKRYNRMADFMQIDRAQADRARVQWMNLREVKDIADAMQTIAKYGQPKPLSDKTRARWS